MIRVAKDWMNGVLITSGVLGFISFCLALFLGPILGYVMNIYQLATGPYSFDNVTFVMVLKIIGVLPPTFFIGTVMGWIGFFVGAPA